MSNGCLNRPPFRSVLPVQDGFYQDAHTRTPRMVPWLLRAATACQYTLSALGQIDTGCTGCKWRAA